MFLSASGPPGTVASCDTLFQLWYRPSETPDRTSRLNDIEYEALNITHVVEEEFQEIIFVWMLFKLHVSKKPHSRSYTVDRIALCWRIMDNNNNKKKEYHRSAKCFARKICLGNKLTWVRITSLNSYFTSLVRPPMASVAQTRNNHI